MRSLPLIPLLDALRRSYWFVPTVMTLLAVALGAALPWIDASFELAWLDALPVTDLGPDGVRALLTTIAASVIGVAGVTFSITIVAVSFASSNHGPRLIGNFMGDRGNQFTLGTFVATFAYCLVVLSAVQEAREEVSLFVPRLSVLVALAMTAAALGMLIFFIHHVPESINIMNIAAGIGEELRVSAERDALGCAPAWKPEERAGARTIQPRWAGYLREVDVEALEELAREHDLRVEVAHRPGSFLTRNDAALMVIGPLDEDVEGSLRAALVLSPDRTSNDAMFLVDELVEIAARALSPGVNDPFTAMTCLDWLRVGLEAHGRSVGCGEPKGDHGDAADSPRVAMEGATFERLASAAFDQTRQYFAADRNATLHALAAMGALAAAVGEGERREAVVGHMKRLARAARSGAGEDSDRAAEVGERLEGALRIARGEGRFGVAEPPLAPEPRPRKPSFRPEDDPLNA